MSLPPALHAVGDIDCSCSTCHVVPSSAAALIALFDASLEAKCHVMIHEIDHPQLEQVFRQWAAIRNFDLVERTMDSGRRTITYTTNIGDGITALLRAPETSFDLEAS